MTDDQTTGREPALPIDADITGREPFIGGEASLARALLELDEADLELSNEVLLARMAGALPQLIATLQGDDQRQWSIAARMIGMLAAGYPESRSQTVPLLVDIFRTANEREDWPVMLMAVDRLGDTADPLAAEELTDILVYSRPRIHGRAADSLVRLGTIALPPLMAAVDARPVSLHRTIRTIRVISRVYPDTIPAITDWIMPLVLNQELPLNYDVALLLGQLRPADLVERLLAIATDTDCDREFRVRAVRAFVHIRDSRVCAPMLELLAGDERFLRYPAARVLCYNRRREDIPRIIELIDHDDPQIRRYAIMVMRRRRIRSAVPAILKSLQDSRREVRREAVIALRRLRDSRSIVPIAQMITDRSKIVRREAISALSSMRRHFPDQHAEIDAGFLRALSDDRLDVRREAIAAIRYAREPGFIALLIPMLKDEDVRIRLDVVLALSLMRGQLRERRVEIDPALREMLDDPDVQVRTLVERTLRS